MQGRVHSCRKSGPSFRFAHHTQRRAHWRRSEVHGMLARTWAELPNSVVSSKAVSNRWLALRTALRSHRPCRNRIGTLNEQIDCRPSPRRPQMRVCNSAASGEQARSAGSIEHPLAGCSCIRFKTSAVSADAAPTLAPQELQRYPSFVDNWCLACGHHTETAPTSKLGASLGGFFEPRTGSFPEASVSQCAWQPKEAPKFTQWHQSKHHFSCKAQNFPLGEPCRPALFSIFAPCSAASWSPAPFFSPASQPRGKEVVLPVSTVLDRFSPAPNLCRGNRCRQAT